MGYAYLNGHGERVSSYGELVAVFEFLPRKNSLAVDVGSGFAAQIQNCYCISVHTDNTVLLTDSGTGRTKMAIFRPTDSECGDIDGKSLTLLAFVCNK